MVYRFGECSLDLETFEFRRGETVVPLEPQVFALLRLLIENRTRLVTRDEILERIWDGRIVSDAAISSRIKSLRQAVGDDGQAQQIIKTAPKLGFRFVAQVEALAQPQPKSPEEPITAELTQPILRPSIAVLPFAVLGGGVGAAIGEALPHDLIAELSRLRWLFVIARGSSFRFRGPDLEIRRVGDLLGVGYCLTGLVEVTDGKLAVVVELADTSSGGVIWSERFRSELEGLHEVRERIVQAVVSALELQIPLHEVQRARLKGPEGLDAWSAYHLGLHHLYRFDRAGNDGAERYFNKALALEPSFARAHAGLSFVHFENAFLRLADDIDQTAARAHRAAERALDCDPLDPFCNLVMGRSFWLRGELEASLPWLERAIHLNPNFAQAKYSRAWTETLLGRAAEGRVDVDAALQLSPLDPLAYGMLGVRAFSHILQDELGEAAEWAERAARTSGAHAFIELIAAVAHHLNGDAARAKSWAQSALRRHPGLSASDFLNAFPFRAPATHLQVRRALRELDIRA